MAVAETARLIASLELDPRKFTGGVDKALGKLGQIEGRFGKLGQLASQGARNAGANIARLGAIAAGGVGLAVRGGIQSLAELEDATTAVDGAIRDLGLTGQVTSGQIATWANQIESSVQAAFDDKEITAAAATLLRFGKVTAENLRPALVVMTDLAVKTGSVDSAATLLGKALADPTKAAGKLARAGIILTKEQQKQITAMVAAGKTGKAQALILAEIEKTTKGAAAASAGPYRDALNTLGDVSEDVKRALAEGFLPVIQRVADFLSKKMADPKFIDQIRTFGKDLAGAFDKAIEIGKNIPWTQIGDSLKIAGAGARALFDAFTMLPPWVQTAVLTGWGLNKLTGGALGGIVGELGKGLIKGVLGMTAGVVNINAGVVNGAGGVPSAAGAAAKGGLGLVSKVFLVGEAIGLALMVNDIREGIAAASTAQAKDVHATTTDSLAAPGPRTAQDLSTKIGAINTGIDHLRTDWLGALQLVSGDSIAELEAARAEVQKQVDANWAVRDSIEAGRNATVSALEAQTAAQTTPLNDMRDKIEASRIASLSIGAKTDAVKTALWASSDRETNRLAAAIHNNRPVVNLTIPITVSGSTRRVIKNYQSGAKIGRTGGPQEFDP